MTNQEHTESSVHGGKRIRITNPTSQKNRIGKKKKGGRKETKQIHHKKKREKDTRGRKADRKKQKRTEKRDKLKIGRRRAIKAKRQKQNKEHKKANQPINSSTNKKTSSITLLEPQSRFGGKPLGIRAGCPQNRTAVQT